MTWRENSSVSRVHASLGNADADVKPKLKRPKGKRAMIKWLKFFRWKKKRDYQQMTQEEKILYKLKKAERKESRLVEGLSKIKPPSPPTKCIHDPEILTPEEHFYYLKMGHKCKNYVPVGRRGIFQGVILNMHLHWKKHQTLKVVVKTFTPEEVKEIAAELARLSGGIILEIHEGNTIIMYRGKNYSQPPTEIMSPRVTLTRKKALDKSKYRDALHAVQIFIPRLERELEALQASMSNIEDEQKPDTASNVACPIDASVVIQNSTEYGGPGFSLSEVPENIYDPARRGPSVEMSEMSESESLSDIFETESDVEAVKKNVGMLYLDKLDAMPVEDVQDDSCEDFDKYLKQFYANAQAAGDGSKTSTVRELDAIDRMFLRAGSLLKKKR